MFWRACGKSGGISRAPAWWGQGEAQQWPQRAKYLQSAQKQRWVEINDESWPTCHLNSQVQKRKHRYKKEREKKRWRNILPGLSPHSTMTWAAYSNTIITEPAYWNLVLIVHENRGCSWWKHLETPHPTDPSLLTNSTSPKSSIYGTGSGFSGKFKADNEWLSPLTCTPCWNCFLEHDDVSSISFSNNFYFSVIKTLKRTGGFVPHIWQRAWECMQRHYSNPSFSSDI